MARKPQHPPDRRGDVAAELQGEWQASSLQNFKLNAKKSR